MTATNVVAAVAAEAGDSGAGRLTELRAAFRSPRLVAGACIVGFFLLLGILGPFFVADPNQLSHAQLAPPSLSHWLGTTQIGQDVFAQLVVSARASLVIGIGAGLLATVVSVVIGISGGYAGGFIDEALSLLSNVVLVIPTLPLVIVILAYVKASGLIPLIVIIALTSWAAAARVLRAQTRLREELGFSVVFITHDLSLLLEISDRLAVMYAGEIVEQAPSEAVGTASAHPYTLGLLRSFPDMRSARRELRGVPGIPAGPAGPLGWVPIRAAV
ncbi:MAG TPA: hypothetical protein VGA04_29545 [Streptosporangiaceae bacterium]